MGSTGEPDRKRRHFSSLSPIAATAAKKQPLLPSSEDIKLDTAVLQFQNQKLLQKLAAQKVEYCALENKFSQLKENQRPYDTTLTVVNKSWDELVSDLESCCTCTRRLSIGQDAEHTSIIHNGSLSPLEDDFLSRLTETSATESSSKNNCSNQMEKDSETACEKSKNILRNIVVAINEQWFMKGGLRAAILKELPENGSFSQNMSSDLETEVKNLRLALNDLILKHKSLARELQSHRDMDAKKKAELKHLKGELDSTIADLDESNCKLATLKAERDATKGAFFPALNQGSKHATNDRVRDKQKDLQDMESALKELMDQASCRLLELKGLHEERIKILHQICNLQNTLKSLKCVTSSQSYLLVRDQLEKSKAEVIQYQTLFEKLQVGKDCLAWREKELKIRTDIVDVFRRSYAIVESRLTDLGIEIQKQIDERKMIESKLEVASREPGRKEIIAEFKAFLSSFPEEMGTMQSQLSKYKEAASDVHSVRADVQRLSNVLDNKAKDCETFSSRSADQVVEMQKLQALAQDLKESDQELKLILDMYKRESADSRGVLEARDLEYKAWSLVQSLKSSLDEHSLELRVKTANKAEAISQQRLATAEADIADLRQKLEVSKRDVSKLSDVLKSKNEENDAYLSEIETIGQAYDDMQTQNQNLLQQITERDDYNIKLVLEGVRARQLQDALLMDKQTMEREIQRANASFDFFDMKAARIEDQLKMCLDEVQKLAEDRDQRSATLENTQKKLWDVRRLSQQARESLEELQSKAGKRRVSFSELQVEVEKERFDKKRIEEELVVVRRKASFLIAQKEGSAVEKLQQEVGEYKKILKCSVCFDRPKEVLITKCYHLFCSACIQKSIETRHRKCPACASSFGPSDVKPVYI